MFFAATLSSAPFFLQVDVKKALQHEGVEAANKLVHGGKEHHPSWLIGRLVRNKESKSKSSSTSCDASSVPDNYVLDLTAKIRAQLQQEMDEKLDQKLREMMQKLSDQNPDLKVNLDDSKQSSEMSPGDDNVTPWISLIVKSFLVFNFIFRIVMVLKLAFGWYLS